MHDMAELGRMLGNHGGERLSSSLFSTLECVLKRGSSVLLESDCV